MLKYPYISNNNIQQQQQQQHKKIPKISRSILCRAGNDNISISWVKLAAENMASPLTYIINKCIRLSVFPTEWKCARISVIRKIDNPKTGDDYRQISILPVLSKVFERLIMEQLCNFIETNNIYSSTQADYRRNHSTNTVLRDER